MSTNNEELKEAVFRKTAGRCHLSGRKLVYKNYGRFGSRGAWEIDHSLPRERGGTDHLNNLLPASISANRRKCARATRTARTRYGRTRAPLSVEKQEEARGNNTLKGVGIGALVGVRFGPVGLLVGSIVGGVIGLLTEVE